MAKRSHDALRARDLGLRSLRHAAPYRLPRRRLTEADYTRWLRRTQSRLEPPSPQRPYWTVWRGRLYVAAGKTPPRAVTAAMRTPFPSS